MRKSNFLAATLLAALTLTSCSVKDGDDESENQPVRFTAGIDQVTTLQDGTSGTRAAGSLWAANDAIGIFMVESATTHYANMQYETKGGDGMFTAVAGDEMYYPMSGNTVKFTAYYPYGSSAALTAPIDVKIGDQNKQSGFDLLYFSGATGSKATATTPVALEFEHKLAKIVMNTVADPSVGKALTGMTVTIKGMNTVNTFNLSTGNLGTAATTPLNITPRTVSNGSKYDAVILPGSYAAGAVTVDFKVGNDTFTWNVGAVSFEGGNEYGYTVTLTRTGVQATGTIKPWKVTNRGGVTAE